MKEEINIRLSHLNKQWQALELAISPRHGYRDERTILKGKVCFNFPDANLIRKDREMGRNQIKFPDPCLCGNLPIDTSIFNCRKIIR